MSKNNKQLSEAQKAVKPVLEEIRGLLEEIKHACSIEHVANSLANIVKTYEEKYDLAEPKPTLREYMDKYSRGAYHHFYFNINGNKFNVIGCNDFILYGNAKLLDMFLVVDDDTRDNGAGCDQYACNHYLAIERIK